MATHKVTLTSGDLDADVTIIGTSEITLYVNKATIMGASSVTVPSNIRLKFEDDGLITIAASETLTILGDLEAGHFQIFDAVNATTSIVKFGSTDSGLGYRELRPEWWGAVGDLTNDDTKALQQMFNVPSQYGTQLMKYVFAPGKDYKFTDTLRIGPDPASPGTLNTSCIVEGNGATLWASPVDIGAAPAIEMGHVTDWLGGSQKLAQVLYMQWKGLHLKAIGQGYGWSGSTGIQISSCQFSTFSDSIWAGFETIVASHSSIGSELQIGGNSNPYTDMNLVGAVTAVLIGGGTVNANNWRWTGGKIQQCTTGMRLELIAQCIVSNVDFSVISGKAIELDTASEVSLKNIYTEGIGDGSLLTDNCVFSLKDSNVINIDSCRINGAAAVGDSDLAYGVYVSGTSSSIRIMNSLFQKHYIADVYVGPDTDSVVITPDNRYEGAHTNVVNRISVSDESGKALDQVAKFDLSSKNYSPWHGHQQNFIPEPYDFTTSFWTLSNVTINGTVLAPDGVSFAQILEFPNTSTAGDTGNPSSLNLSTSLNIGTPIDGNTVVLQYWVLGVNHLSESNPITQNTSFHSIINRDGGGYTNTQGRDVVVSKDGYYDGYQSWTFVRHEYAPPDGSIGNRSILTNITFNAGSDGLSVALWGVQVFVKTALNDVRPSMAPVLGFFDTTPITQESNVRLLDNLTGEVPDSIIEIIPDPADTPSNVDALRDDLVANTIPAVRANISDLTAQINSLRMIIKNYGLMKDFDVKTMTGLTLYIDPAISANSPTDGNDITGVNNVINNGTDFDDFSGSLNPPEYSDGYINGHPVFKFDPSNEEVLQNTGSTLADYMTASEFVVLVVAQIDEFDAPSGGPYNNEALMAAAGNFGLFLTNPTTLNGTFYSTVFETVSATVPLKTPFLVEWRLKDGFASIRVNDGVTDTAAAGNMSNLAKTPLLGGRGTGFPYLNGQIATIIILNEYNSEEVESARAFLNEKYDLW